jgi:hypothetical protein
MNNIAKECMPYSNEAYQRYCKSYQDVVNSIQNNDNMHTRRGPLVVLDLFSGIGSAVVVLKRLKIAVKTVISVEHDPVAAYVTQYNHDRTYNDLLSKDGDGIQYVYTHRTFKDLTDNLDNILSEYGPIDLIVGGPPCTDHSSINASRSGIHGESGQYLVEFGKLISTIERHDMQTKQLYFLSENVVFKDDMEDVIEAYGGIPPVQIDAKDFSPCKRARNYWLNLPVDAVDQDSVESESYPHLENGFIMPSQCINPHAKMRVKANTFMASKGRLDDKPRMMIAKETISHGIKRYQIGTFSVADREKMLGFPVHYVHKAVKHLYQTLKKGGFDGEFTNEHWYHKLDPKYHHFVECSFKFKNCTDDFYAIKIKHEDSDVSFTYEEYAKHLLGNAWSIPVVEMLLSPLKKICTERQYDDFDYSFPWPPHSLT